MIALSPLFPALVSVLQVSELACEASMFFLDPAMLRHSAVSCFKFTWSCDQAFAHFLLFRFLGMIFLLAELFFALFLVFICVSLAL